MSDNFRVSDHSLDGTPDGPIITYDLPAEHRLMSRADAAAFLGISIRQLDKLASAGSIRIVRIGGRRLVPGREVRRIANEGIE